MGSISLEPISTMAANGEILPKITLDGHAHSAISTEHDVSTRARHVLLPNSSWGRPGVATQHQCLHLAIVMLPTAQVALHETRVIGSSIMCNIRLYSSCEAG